MNAKRLLRSCSLLSLVVLAGGPVLAQIAINPVGGVATNNAKAMLDLNLGAATPVGFLVPRVTFAQRPPAPAEGLFIYQTDDGTGVNIDQPRGFYYWSTDVVPNRWMRAANGPGWKLGGNTLVAATDYLGTTNNQPVVVRTNGTQRMIIQTTGQVQLGEPPLLAATDVLDVSGAVRVFGTSAAAATEGAIRWNATENAHEGYVNNPLVAPPGQIQYVGWYQLENVFKTRERQRYQSVPVISCQYPAPGTIPAGATPGSWPIFDANGAAADPSTAATLETPYAMFWEDSRHQYLYRSQELQNLNVCPNTNVNGIAFRTSVGGSVLGMRNIRISMKNTTTASFTDFDYTGLQLCASINGPFVPVNGWNAHAFSSPWQWLGPGWNMLVEFGFDNQDWTTDCGVFYENTAYNGMAGARCDACGHMFTPGSATCTWNSTQCAGGAVGVSCASAPNNTPPLPATYAPNTQSPQLFTDATHLQCQGWGHTPGYQLTFAQNASPTCDCTFQYTALVGVTARHPILKINAQVNGIGITFPRGGYLLADKGVMIGDYTSWASTGTSPNYQFKGPGTLSAFSSVWGGSVLLSDHVFDNYYDGAIRPEDAKQAIGYKHFSVKEMAEFVESEHHLPTIGGRSDWNELGSFSLDQLTNQLWVTVETQSLYIKELNDRMEALQQYLVDKRLRELKK